MRSIGRSMWMLFAVVACGGTSHQAADAPASDAASAPTARVDARDDAAIDAMADAGARPVAITITASGFPRAGVQVAFSNADSSPVATLVTDGSGTASQVMAAGGMVTAIDPFVDLAGSGSAALFTYEGVQPGDHLQLAGSAARTSFTYVTIDTAAVAGATSYLVSAPPCGNTVLFPSGSGASGTNSFPPCAGADLYIVALGSANNVLGSLYHPGVAFSNNATVDLTGDAFVAPLGVHYAVRRTSRRRTSASAPSSRLGERHALRHRRGPDGHRRQRVVRDRPSRRPTARSRSWTAPTATATPWRR